MEAPPPRTLAVGFTIGNKGYIGTGGGSSQFNDFWEWDPANNTWTQKAPFPGIGRYAAVGFSIGSKGYIGTGIADVNNKNDFWEYDPLSNSWTQKASFGGSPRGHAVGFSIGNKGYIGTGSGDTGFMKDFWEYDPTSNTWSQKADFGGSARYLATGFGINDKGYIGLGWANDTLRSDFWEWDMSSNSWTQKTDFGGSVRISATGFSNATNGYIGTGQTGFTNGMNDFWEYIPSNSCSSTATATITVNSGSITTANNSPICAGGTLNLAATGATNYLWTGPNGFHSTDPNPVIPAILAADSGTYTVSVNNIAGCGIISVPTKVIINPNPKPSLLVTNLHCYGDSSGAAIVNEALLAGASPYSYLWSTGATTSGVSGLPKQTLTVNIVDSNGCFADTSFTLTEPDVIASTIPDFSNYQGGYNVSCSTASNGSVDLNVTGGTPPYSFSWNGGAYNTQNLNNVPAGIYTVVITDTNGCATTNTIELTAPLPLTINSITSPVNANGHNIACKGESGGKIITDITGGVPPYSFNWTGPGGFVSTDSNLVSLRAGLYSLTVTDINGCSTVGSINLTEPDTSLALLNNTNINSINIRCFNGSDGLAYVDTVFGGTSPFQYLWSNGITDKIIQNVPSGNYSVHITDANGCVLDKSIFLDQPDPIITHITSSDYRGFGISCHGLSDGFITTDTVFGGVSPYSYYWSTGSSNSSLTGLPTGNYDLTITDANGCIDTTSVTLTEPVEINAYAGPDKIIGCTGNASVMLNGSSSNSGIIFNWITSGGGHFTSATNTATAIVDSAGTYILIVTDTASVCTARDTAIVVIDSVTTPTVTITNLNDTIVFVSSSALGYQWFNSNGIIPGAINQIYIPLDTNSYYVQTANSNGCISNNSSIVVKPMTYVFIGNGNWDVDSNWIGKIVPPSHIGRGEEIIIDPVISGVCLLNRAQAINTGAKLSIIQGKNFVVEGNVVITDTLASVATASVTGITSNSAITGGNIISEGAMPVTARGICFATLPNPTLADNSITGGSGIGSFTISLSVLLPNTTYYVRAYAITALGTSYGNEVSFTTLSF